MGYFADLAINSLQQPPGLPVPYNDCRRKCPGPRGKASKPEVTQLVSAWQDNCQGAACLDSKAVKEWDWQKDSLLPVFP